MRLKPVFVLADITTGLSESMPKICIFVHGHCIKCGISNSVPRLVYLFWGILLIWTMVTLLLIREHLFVEGMCYLLIFEC